MSAIRIALVLLAGTTIAEIRHALHPAALLVCSTCGHARYQRDPRSTLPAKSGFNQT